MSTSMTHWDARTSSPDELDSSADVSRRVLIDPMSKCASYSLTSYDIHVRDRDFDVFTSAPPGNLAYRYDALQRSQTTTKG